MARNILTWSVVQLCYSLKMWQMTPALYSVFTHTQVCWETFRTPDLGTRADKRVLAHQVPLGSDPEQECGLAPCDSLAGLRGPHHVCRRAV